MIRSIRYFAVGINSGLLQLLDLWDLAHQNRLIRSLDSTQSHATRTKTEGRKRGDSGERRNRRGNFNRVRNNHSSSGLGGAQDRPGQQRRDGRGSRDPTGVDVYNTKTALALLQGQFARKSPPPPPPPPPPPTPLLCSSAREIQAGFGSRPRLFPNTPRRCLVTCPAANISPPKPGDVAIPLSNLCSALSPACTLPHHTASACDGLLDRRTGDWRASEAVHHPVVDAIGPPTLNVKFRAHHFPVWFSDRCFTRSCHVPQSGVSQSDDGGQGTRSPCNNGAMGRAAASWIQECGRMQVSPLEDRKTQRGEKGSSIT
ncbi:unnamed protein product [Pleuronectes platessa]|uniref:Uncharacterized protein n=1 Tax=Pleuronectes platessa TaxID=8262 RepID=A0A9N7TUK7_PLEPL|nr:unnamed protein product [Pleuronectes platessa]